MRQDIGKNLMGSDFIVSSTTRAGGDANSVIDRNRLFGADDTFKGRWILAVSGTNDGEVRRCTLYTEGTVGNDAAGSHDMTVATGFTNTVPNAMGYELWPPEYFPTLADDALNRAINRSIGRFYRREESVALHGDGVTQRFDLPGEFQMVDRIEYRGRVNGEVIHDFESLFDETTDSDFAQSLDDQVKLLSGQSLKMVVAAGASAGDFVTASFTAKDLSKYTHLEGFIRSSVALSANDYVVHLNDTAVLADGNDQESINVPAASADIKAFFHVALAAPENLTAITSIGLEMNVDKGAHTVWFDHITAVNHDTGDWVKIPKQAWRIDQEGNDLVFIEAPTSRLLKISGGSHPAQMTADTDVATVPESFLIAYATYLMLSGGSRASRDDADGRRSLARDWLAIAEREKGKFPPLINARRVA